MEHFKPITHALRRLLKGERAKWLIRSTKTTRFLEQHIALLFAAWAAAMAGLAIFKAATSPTRASSLISVAEMVLPYALAALAPAAGYLLASAAFPKGADHPRARFAMPGNWRAVSREQAQRSPAYGPAGIVATILIGLLLNVAVRTAEFATALPAMDWSAPKWALAITLAMTADLAVMNFFYMVCFVMALRAVPLFPRMLLFTWLLDLQMQLAVAMFVGNVPLPDSVSSAMALLLQGNVQKILLSMAIWLPILILSRRINLTYRLREPA